MESNLIWTLFKKLLDALRIREPVSRSEIASPEKRSAKAFSLISDGITIRGRVLFPSEHPSRLYPTVIICHGIPGSGTARPKDDPGYEALARELTSQGMAAVIFNFRGCGESGGNFDMTGWTRDLDAVLDLVLNTPHVDPTRVMVLGFSGGGAAAIRVSAENDKIFSLAVVGTPADFSIFQKEPQQIVDDFKERGIIRDADFPKHLDRWISGFVEIEPKRWIGHFRGKHILIIHGDADELIPLDQAYELKERAPEGISELVIIPGGVHRLRLDPRCIEILKSWFLKVLGWKP
ncbi:MAG: alpha/beta fold hydrolase [Desulfomonile tiedjei]|uniref:Alpha/beta fold hydrolase n=1 Tax=Desulfomonile tiedjei TaxID=2358 RepID=A0A9D6V6F8_9BACT|nr:alpha/beta fold hydrolase [Desulfomonile tiedjei]